MRAAQCSQEFAQQKSILSAFIVPWTFSDQVVPTTFIQPHSRCVALTDFKRDGLQALGLSCTLHLIHQKTSHTLSPGLRRDGDEQQRSLVQYPFQENVPQQRAGLELPQSRCVRLLEFGGVHGPGPESPIPRSSIHCQDLIQVVHFQWAHSIERPWRTPLVECLFQVTQNTRHDGILQQKAVWIGQTNPQHQPIIGTFLLYVRVLLVIPAPETSQHLLRGGMPEGGTKCRHIQTLIGAQGKHQGLHTLVPWSVRLTLNHGPMPLPQPMLTGHRNGL
mmetsp:Transcript_27099/g.43021  ORF Transcript_27099/g.43021 Transcript_27099/m.43021 type:complete len:276 (+) Transcript_27099:1280-2107(+)